MTPYEFRAIGQRLLGPGWQTRLARLLGVADRTVRRWASGDSPIPEGLPADLARLEAAGAGWPRDRWLIATDPESQRDYLIHTREPRFIARVSLEDPEADEVTGITYSCRSGEVLCEIVWFDPPPLDEPSLLRLLQEGESALEVHDLDSED